MAASQAGSQREPFPEPRGSRLRGRRATRGDPSAPGCRDRPRDPERFRRSAPPSAGPREADTRLGEEDAPHGRCSWCSGTARASAPKGGTTGRGQRPRGPGGRARSDTRPSSDRGPPQCTRATPGALASLGPPPAERRRCLHHGAVARARFGDTHARDTHSLTARFRGGRGWGGQPHPQRLPIPAA